MAVTPQQQEHLVALTTAMFNAPPGAEFLAEFEGYLEQGQSIEQIAANLAATEAFNSQFEGMTSTAEKIDKVLEGLSITQDSPTYAEAFAFFDNNLAAGRNPWELLVEAGEFFYNTDDPKFANAADTFLNKVEAGVYHSATLGLPSGSLDELQQSIANVTEDPSSVARVKDSLDLAANPPTEDVLATVQIPLDAGDGWLNTSNSLDLSLSFPSDTEYHSIGLIGGGISSTSISGSVRGDEAVYYIGMDATNGMDSGGVSISFVVDRDSKDTFYVDLESLVLNGVEQGPDLYTADSSDFTFEDYTPTDDVWSPFLTSGMDYSQELDLSELNSDEAVMSAEEAYLDEATTPELVGIYNAEVEFI
ncbi:hypothetical protein MHM84_21305 [Halomonas sp. McH1-25]|uniref:hypothetical protein n=1 Tax=unclassified Halomonas TaxID=2609666 RepID=UPI001EF43E52|nr:MULTISPECIES: hypothetical protein [unclassified Halomonas]MCG7602275.1 hypothetical protein [Halomonas sp. McH1-25]MCP1344700.1 hypothetical protein [Halomonas sp. FL8]MCP1363288.1 hypothetical protein [Halomonas sp. BBD45]MCP1364018.1 hypothetical protein [Halomonas sp. BBD48]